MGEKNPWNFGKLKIKEHYEMQPKQLAEVNLEALNIYATVAQADW